MCLMILVQKGKEKIRFNQMTIYFRIQRKIRGVKYFKNCVQDFFEGICTRFFRVLYPSEKLIN